MAGAPKNTDITALYIAVAKAISTWTTIERQLHQIFDICLTLVIMQPGGGYSYSNPIPTAVLDSIDGFRGKLNMIDAALAAALSGMDDEADAILQDWAVERKKVSALHGNRNQLAHWNVTTVQSNPEKPPKPVLMPANMSPIYEPPQGVTETDINQWAANFQEAGVRLSAIAERLASHRGLQELHLALTASQIRVCLPGDPIPLELLTRHLSERR